MNSRLHRPVAIGLCMLFAAVLATACSDDSDGPSSDGLPNAVDASGGGSADAGGGGDAAATNNGGEDASQHSYDTSGSADAAGEDSADPDPTDVASDEDADVPAAECGNGMLEEGERCDDGEITSGCDTYHDGGDGLCRPPGECSDEYVLKDDATCAPAKLERHIHVHVDNFCNLWVDPTEIRVPEGQTVSLEYHNHSADYSVDVWGSYAGGFLDLEPGKSWDDPFEHCASGDRPYQAGAEISVAGLGVNDQHCPGHNFVIHCE
jgi:hypothetical protein